MMDLDRLRDEIDEIDARIVRCLGERAEKVLQVGAEKRRCGLPLRDAGREDEVCRMVKALNRGPLSDDAVASVFRQLFTVFTELQAQDG